MAAEKEAFDFGKRLRQLRKSRKLSQAEAGKLIGKSRTAISKYELNTLTPSFTTIIRIAQTYNASLDYMFGFTDRNSIFIDDLEDKQQKLILDMLESFRASNRDVKISKRHQA